MAKPKSSKKRKLTLVATFVAPVSASLVVVDEEGAHVSNFTPEQWARFQFAHGAFEPQRVSAA